MTSLSQNSDARNVLRVAATYAVVAWIIIEAGSVLLSTLAAAGNGASAYVILSRWLFSCRWSWPGCSRSHPTGSSLRRMSIVRSRLPRRTGRRLDFVFIGLLVIALGISVTLNVTGMRDAQVAAPPTIDRSSIAVLPFTSRSTDPENQLFADGIHDDLLTRLANIGSLKVISRTSMMEYRDTTKNLRQIAEELGVGTVLEGAVQRVGDSVRINAQLIDASTDEHIWAKSYDRATQCGQFVCDTKRDF